ncbi:MAG: diguanylate cyclase, partial [Pseudomonadota bacterium]
TLELLQQRVGLAVQSLQLTLDLADQSRRDPLTGLFNRRFLDEVVHNDQARTDRLGDRYSLIMLDVDYLKTINDTHGHEAGDRALKRLAATITASLRSDDIAFRYGGEEFVVVLPNATLTETRSVARRIQTTLRSAAAAEDEASISAFSLTVSGGIATAGIHGDSPEALLRAADSALYAAKSAGRDTICVAQRPEGRSKKPAATEDARPLAGEQVRPNHRHTPPPMPGTSPTPPTISSTDGLTGACDRPTFLRQLENLGEKRRHLALLFVDVDRFRSLNDIDGFAAGDELLKQTSSILRPEKRSPWLLARLGSDEFGILTSAADERAALAIARDLTGRAANTGFQWLGRSHPLHLSVGVAHLAGSCTEAGAVLREVEVACAIAKARGGNQVCAVRGEQEIDRRESARQAIAQVRHALEENLFELHAQPIMELTGPTRGTWDFEFLLRLRLPTGQLLPPKDFLPAAEQYAWASILDRWVVKTAIDLLQRHTLAMDRIGKCFLNLSAQSLSDQRFGAFLQESINQCQIAPQKFCFEVTESAEIANVETAIEILKALRDAGSSVALDDFGSGWSSFRYLRALPADIVKIDGSLVKDTPTCSLELGVVRSLNEIAHLHGKRTVAEHVSTDDTLACVKSLGVDYAQGYAIGKPVAASAFLDELCKDKAM